MNWKAKVIKNPWANANLQNVFADGDYGYSVKTDKKSNQSFQFGTQSYVEEIKRLCPNSQLTFHCLPSPYSGNPDANIYCLNMNIRQTSYLHYGKEFVNMVHFVRV